MKTSRRERFKELCRFLGKQTDPKVARKVGKALARQHHHDIKAVTSAMRDLIRATACAPHGSYEMSVAGILGIRAQQMAARNAQLLEKQVKTHTTLSPLEMAQAARGLENGNGKGGMAPGHTPAI